MRETRPLAAGLRRQAANHLELRWSRAIRGERQGKGTARLCQVGIGKTNASEPLMTRRKRRNDVKTGRQSLAREQFWGYPLTARAASGVKVASVRFRLVQATGEPVASMLREPSKWKPHKDLSTDARHRGGPTRSSEEGSVMGLERRGWIVSVLRHEPTSNGRSS